MNDNERAMVEKLLNLARFAIIAMLVIGGYVNRSILVGMV